MSVFGRTLFSQGYQDTVFLNSLSKVILILLYCILELVPTGKIERSTTEEKTPDSVLPSKNDNLSMLFTATESLDSYYPKYGRLAAGLIAENLNSSYLGDYRLGSKMTYSVLLSIPTTLRGPHDN